MSSPKAHGTDDLCPLCKRPKRKHTEKEMEVCMKKLKEFKNKPEGGAGIQ